MDSVCSLQTNFFACILILLIAPFSKHLSFKGWYWGVEGTQKKGKIYQSLGLHYLPLQVSTSWPWPVSGPLPRASRINKPGGQLQITPQQHPTSSTNNTPKGQTLLSPEPTKATATLWAVGVGGRGVFYSHRQPSQQISLRDNPTHWHPNSNESSTTTEGHTQHTRDTSEAPGWTEQRDGTTKPHRTPTTQKATLPRLGGVENLPNT